MKKLSKILSIVLCLAMVAGFFTFTASAEERTWTKVTEAPTDWTGTYLIVYEKSTTQAYVFNAETCADANGNYATVTRNGNTITADTKYGVTLAAYSGGYSIKATAANKFIGSTSNASSGAGANEMKIGTTAYKNTITLENDGSVKVQGTASILRFNSQDGRFRYYKNTTYTSQQKIYLYKLDEVSSSECDHTTGNWTVDGDTCYKMCTCGDEELAARAEHSYDATTHKCRCGTVEPFPAVTLPTGTFLIKQGTKYVTSTEYTYTSSSGSTKIELVIGAQAAAAVFSVEDNGDGTVSFVWNNKFLYCNGTDVKFVAEESQYTKFTLESAGYNGECFIKSSVSNSYGDQYLEVYSGYLTCYKMSGDTAIYTFVTEAHTCDHANAAWVKDAEKCSKVCPNCGTVTVPEAAHDFTNGADCRCGTAYVCEHADAEWTKNSVKHSKVCECGEVLVAEANHNFVNRVCECGVKHLLSFNIEQDGKYVTAEKYTYVGSSSTKDQLVMSDDKADAAVFTIMDIDGKLTFVCEGKFLYADGTNVRLVDTEGEYTVFTFEEAGEDAYFFRTSVYAYSKWQYLETYNGNYLTCYGMNDSTTNKAAFTFTLVDPDAAQPCDHADAEWTVTDTTHAKVCECGETIVPEAAHDFTNGNCVCGKAAPATGGGEGDGEGTTTLVPGVVKNPAVNTAYKFGMVQAGLGKTLYLTGEMNGYYYATTENWNEAVDVYMESTTGGVYLYFMKAGVKTYLNIVPRDNDPTKVNAVFGTSPVSVWTYNTTYGTFTTNAVDKVWYLGTYSTNKTFGPSETWRLDEAGAIGTTQFVAQMYGMVSADTGDYTISVMVAAFVVSAMGIVALTMKKKED